MFFGSTKGGFPMTTEMKMSNYPWIESYCLEKKGAEMDYKPEWHATRFMIRGKMFAMMGGDATGRPIITVKLAPSNGQMLRTMHSENIIPGYYMNKEHWNSVYLLGDLSESILKDMLDEAYTLILGTFSKKVQAEIQQL
jgi:predicted DNA-binding protein (MmcQ/YjbR family)